MRTYQKQTTIRTWYLYTKSGQTLQGSFSEGRKEYRIVLQKLKVPENRSRTGLDWIPDQIFKNSERTNERIPDQIPKVEGTGEFSSDPWEKESSRISLPTYRWKALDETYQIYSAKSLSISEGYFMKIRSRTIVCTLATCVPSCARTEAPLR